MSGTSQVSTISGDSAALFGPLSSTGRSDAATASLFDTTMTPKLFQDAIPPGAHALPSTPQQSSSPAAFPPPPAGDQIAMATPSHPAPSSTDATDSAASELTQKELEAYRAPAFVLGKIPEHPPPPDLC